MSSKNAILDIGDFKYFVHFSLYYENLLKVKINLEEIKTDFDIELEKIIIWKHIRIIFFEKLHQIWIIEPLNQIFLVLDLSTGSHDLKRGLQTHPQIKWVIETNDDKID